ncbi:biotin-dependent carboxyltransferase family protein [Cellulomonas sp. HZM]|uniref:5-oxoprolinase subunit C family protein n=1 Tax=Cellulomonas sp. HZM TaxID=1454010 RepID=UPI0004935454|nr:biotin-dependent carboxyltransferase family protein [Cellulomonas sp. HZM]
MTASTALEVVDPGVLALVQDLGRPGWAHVGVGRSGAADPAALRRANRLVGNPEGAAGIEALLGGLTVRALGPVTLALCGAPGEATVDGRPVGRDTVLEVPDGAVVHVALPGAGLRTYLAVRGGVDVPAVLGSRSSDALAGVGPVPLSAGDVLPVGAPPAPTSSWPVVDAAPQRPWGVEVVVPLEPGPHARWFVDGPKALTHADGYHVTPATDRVAVRLAGLPLRRVPDHQGRELAPAGLVAGAVQVPADGMPIVFGPDHPVTGGYPVVAVAGPVALGRLMQVRPGEVVRFVVR